MSPLSRVLSPVIGPKLAILNLLSLLVIQYLNDISDYITSHLLSIVKIMTYPFRAPPFPTACQIYSSKAMNRERMWSVILTLPLESVGRAIWSASGTLPPYPSSRL